MELIKFIFQNIWHFLGAVIILYVVASCIAGIISAFKGAVKSEAMDNLNIKYPFVSEQWTVEGRTFWVIESKALKGCVGQGDTLLKALMEFADNETEWLKCAQKYDIPIPKEGAQKDG